ncbi:MAG TPA: hypothetical protein VFH37_03195 [Candidatus Saccharimonadales bacterium]|nr:hypothetical protein [Candidatus Saccharimonadales bacterium]
MPDLKIGTELPETRQHRAAIQASANGTENLVYPSVQAYFPLGCVACKVICEAVYEKMNGKRTGRDPGVFWMEPETYARVRSESLKSMSRLLLASLEPENKEKLSSPIQSTI